MAISVSSLTPLAVVTLAAPILVVPHGSMVLPVVLTRHPSASWVAWARQPIGRISEHPHTNTLLVTLASSVFFSLLLSSVDSCPWAADSISDIGLVCVTMTTNMESDVDHDVTTIYYSKNKQNPK